MNKIKQLFVAAAALAMMATACKKDSNSTTPPTNSTSGSFTATVDGNAFVATKIQAYYIAGTQILGILGSNGKVGIAAIIAAPAVGSFTTDSASNTIHNKLSYSPDTTNQNGRYISNADHIVVTAFDAVKGTISGTFSFTGLAQGAVAAGAHTITQGVFTNISIASVVKSSISATVGGNTFTPVFTQADTSNKQCYRMNNNW
jgi:hypothetical protein